MKIALGSDHRGDHAASVLEQHLQQAGYNVTILGERGPQSRDYPDVAWLAGKAVGERKADAGVLVCGSGNGVAIAANKIPGVRAGIAHNVETAALAKRHNNANILCIGADKLNDATICTIVDAWLDADFEGGRHARRVEKINAIERGDDPRKLLLNPPPAPASTS
jgi:ribose 5-phosphate isomerase B